MRNFIKMFFINVTNIGVATWVISKTQCIQDVITEHYTPFTRSSKHRANIKQARWNSVPGSNVGLGLAHS